MCFVFLGFLLLLTAIWGWCTKGFFEYTCNWGLGTLGLLVCKHETTIFIGFRGFWARAGFL